MEKVEWQRGNYFLREGGGGWCPKLLARNRSWKGFDVRDHGVIPEEPIMNVIQGSRMEETIGSLRGSRAWKQGTCRKKKCLIRRVSDGPAHMSESRFFEGNSSQRKKSGP